jgi:hypothetical protein
MREDRWRRMTREEAKAYIIRHCNPDYPKGKTEWEIAINMAISALEQPEIVYCKDCGWWNEKERYCHNFGHNMEGDDFCSLVN